MNFTSSAAKYTREERVIVISLMKSGTHLIQELMVALGYRIYGQSRIPPEIRPILDTDTRLRIMRMLYDKDTFDVLEKADDSSLTEAGDRAWEALGWAWQLRFGMPLGNRYGVELINTDLIEQALPRTASSNFADTPSGVCWILPELDIKKVDGRFIQEWSRTGNPKIIFNYRDPRDVILSMVNFLSGKTAQGFGNFSEFLAFSRILDSKSSLEEKLTYALTDRSFPCLGDFDRMLWLFHHPDICKVSFEEMVGIEGGGPAELQRQAVARVIDFVGADITPESVTHRLFRRDAFSFFKGQIGAWREVFTPEHQQLAASRFGEILPFYGSA